MTTIVHPSTLNEGDRIIIRGEEVTFLYATRRMFNLACGCCSDYADDYTIDFRRDDETIDEESGVEEVILDKLATPD